MPECCIERIPKGKIRKEHVTRRHRAASRLSDTKTSHLNLRINLTRHRENWLRRETRGLLLLNMMSSWRLLITIVKVRYLSERTWRRWHGHAARRGRAAPVRRPADTLAARARNHPVSRNTVETFLLTVTCSP